MLAREKAQALLIDVNRAALAMLDAAEADAKLDAAATPQAPLRRVNLGIYLFSGDDLPDNPGTMP
jgi:hypothetical protein